MASAVARAREVLVRLRQDDDGSDQQVVRLPDSAGIEAARCAASSTLREVRQIVPFVPSGWLPSDFANELWRQLARESLDVARVYVVPHRGVAMTELEEQLQMDRESGVKCSALYLSDIQSEVREVIADEMWLLDGESVVIHDDGSATSSAGRPWTFSERVEDVKRVCAAFDRISELARSRPDADRGSLDLEEPLVLSADLMHGVGGVLCASDHVDRSSCSWYHGAWQYLRLLDMVSTPTWHRSFYDRAIGDAIESPDDPRVLITGTADYSMFAYVDHALRKRESNGEITVLDLCATPLFACQWYAKRVGRAIQTVQQDLFDPQLKLEDGSFDLVCTDAFLTRFTPAEAKDVIEAWWRLLRPGGHVVTTVRLHDLSPRIRDASQQERDFVVSALESARRWEPFLQVSAREIERLAAAYAKRMASSPIGDAAIIRSMFSDAGFAVTESAISDTPGELGPTTYLQLICRKSIDKSIDVKEN